MSQFPTRTPGVGFPQAPVGQQPYQHVQQYNQYVQQQPQQNLTNGQQNYGNPNPFPFPTTSHPPQLQQNQQAYPNQTVKSLQPPVNGAPPPPLQNNAGLQYNPPTIQKPLANQQYQPVPTPAPVPFPYAPQQQAPSFPGAPQTAPPAAPPATNGQYAPPTAPTNPAFAAARPAPIPQSYANPPPYPAPGAQPAPAAQVNYGYPGQQQQQQMQQQFGQMNMGGMPPQTPPQMHHPNGSQYQSDIIDLMVERNIQQQGFEDIDVILPQTVASPEIRVDPNIFRSTLNLIPQTEELLKKSRLPFALTLHPFRDVKNLNIIQTSNIVRCRYCRTYINPYVYMPDQRHWRCNLCNRNNDLPDDFCWDPASKSFGDPRNRPEIQNATVEFIAPAEYMLRPPQPPIYLFILDISENALRSGYLRTFSEQFLINLDQMPGDERTLIAFIAVDQLLHFFSFHSTKRGPSEMIIDDVEDGFLPSADTLLVPVKQFKEVIRSFVKQLPTFYQIGPNSNGNCLGAALKLGQELITPIGGRVSVFQVSLPNLGPGTLKNREEPGSNDAPQNLGPATDFYKAFSLQCTGDQICIDLFAFNSQYLDIATLSEMAKFSTGCVYRFANYNKDDLAVVKNFEKTLTRYFTRKIGFEAVLRVRTTRGISLSGFYGNFFVRSPDLLAFANVNPDSALAAQVQIEEKLPAYVSFQSALLYTSSKGDRRIRVHTMCLPTSGDLLQVYDNFDLKATVSYLAKIAVDRSMSGNSLADSREGLVNAVVDSVGAYQKAVSRNGGMLVPRKGNLRLFPSFVLAMLKHPAFSSSRGIKVDDRAAAMLMLRFSPLEQILSEFYPKLYRLNELAIEGAKEHPQWPQPLPLSFEHVQRDGVYLLEAGSALFVYVSSAVEPSFLINVFGAEYKDIHANSLIERENEVSKRVFAFFKRVTLFRFYLGTFIVVTEHSPNREQFIRRLVDDRSESSHSYVEFLQHLKREINN